MYTSTGKRVRNPTAYAAAGGQAYTRAGNHVSNPAAYSAAIEASVMQNTSTPKYLYHYTDTASAREIVKSGSINPSTRSGDCALGEGVYFTAKRPRTNTQTLLSNNYDGAGPSTDASRVGAYVRVDADRVNAQSGRSQLGRDVFVVPSAVDLSSAGAKTGLRKAI